MNLNSLSLSFGASIWGAYAWWHCPFLMANTGWGRVITLSSHLSLLIISFICPGRNWLAGRISPPADHSLSEFEFDVIIGADGHRNTLEGDDSS